MTVVEEVPFVIIIIKAKLDAQVTVSRPMRNGVKKEWSVSPKAEIGLARRGRLDVGNVAIVSKVLLVPKVHGS